MQRGFSVILVPSTGPSPQKGLWQRETGGKHEWTVWCGQGPAGAWAAHHPCAGHTDAVGAACPFASVSAFSWFNS